MDERGHGSAGAGRVWTIGHSTLPIGEFVGLLTGAGVRVVADVRAYPASRRWPQFNREALAAALAGAGIGYEHFPELGGRRKARAGSRNTAWRNEAFRGYADYMETGEFSAGAARLEGLARGMPAAFLCAERHWSQCHRGLIADWMKARGWEVVHIVGEGETEVHPYTKAARVVEGRLSYEGDDGPDGLFATRAR